jgi:chromate transporter
MGFSKNLGTTLGDLAPPPKTASEMFWAFSNLALRGFGGVLPWAQRVIVEEKRWMNREDFLEVLAFAQLLPGPNVCNLALMIGDRFLGWRGAVASFVGMFVFPSVIVACMALFYDKFAHLPLVRGALQGMACAAAALIMSTGIKLGMTYRGRWLWLLPALAGFVAIGVARRPMLETLMWLLPGSIGAAWWQAGRQVFTERALARARPVETVKANTQSDPAQTSSASSASSNSSTSTAASTSSASSASTRKEPEV